ncbi:phosphoribosyltransferase domain-containing protein [Vibrio splendidus]
MKTISLSTGKLKVTTTRIHPAYNSITDLIGFAARQNPKRGFLFVSKVLGKHIPVAPSVARNAARRLAEQIDTDDYNYFIGMSETATCLGALVADECGKRHVMNNLVYQHTTREYLNREIWGQIGEAHSHAAMHALYRPCDSLIARVEQSSTLVLIDDEISTGNTLINLVNAVRERLPNLKKVKLVSLVSWLTDASKEALKAKLNPKNVRNKLEIEFVSLAEGSFQFTANPSMKNIELDPSVDSSLSLDGCDPSWGITGLSMPMVETADTTERLVNLMKINEVPQVSLIDRKVSLVGTGEFMLGAFMIAESFERSNVDVVFQSTTRSPALTDEETILRSTQFDFYKMGLCGSKISVRHFMYNSDPERRDYYIADNVDKLLIYSKGYQPNLNESSSYVHAPFFGESNTPDLSTSPLSAYVSKRSRPVGEKEL